MYSLPSKTCVWTVDHGSTCDIRKQTKMSASESTHFDSKAAIVEDEMKEISFRAKVLRTFAVALAWLCMVRKHRTGLR